MSGARRHSDAPSTAQVRTVIDAGFYSFCAMKPLNRMITIHFGKARVVSHIRAHLLLGDFLKHAGDWLNKRGVGPAYYVYSFENPEAGGLHAHVLYHVPFDLWHDFTAAEVGWIIAATKKSGGSYRQGTLVSGEMYYFADLLTGAATLEDYLTEGLRNSLQYLLKGSKDGISLRLLGIDTPEKLARLPNRCWPSPQGPVLGKRAGVSESLSRHRQLFPREQLRPGLTMAGREARARSILRDLGLEFTPAAMRGRTLPPTTAWPW